MYCRSCLKQIRDDYKICPYCGRAQKQNKSGSDLPLGYSPRKNKIMVICIIVIILLTFLGTLAPNTIYKIKLIRFNDAVRDAIVEADDTCGIIRDVWHDSIYEIDRDHTRPYTQYKGRFYTDFEQALKVLNASKYMHKQKEIISDHQNHVYKLYKGLRNYPDKYSDHYRCARLMCDALDILVKLANNQDNFSYIEYSEITQKTVTAFWDASVALDIYIK